MGVTSWFFFSYLLTFLILAPAPLGTHSNPAGAGSVPQAL